MRSEKSKGSILKAAIEAFSTKGYNGVSIRDVAAAAGVNHAIIRYHYGSKEDLWLAVFQHLMSGMTDLRNTEPFNNQAENLELEFRNFVRARVAYISENPQLLKIILLEIIEGGPRFTQIDTLMRMFYQESLQIVETMQKVGTLRELKVKDLFFILPTLVGGRFLYPNCDKDFDGNPIAADDVIEAHTNLVMDLLYQSKKKSQMNKPSRMTF